jgi:hypothetical protein
MRLKCLLAFRTRLSPSHRERIAEFGRRQEIPRRYAPRDDTLFPAVIPNVSEESAVGNTAGKGDQFKEIPRPGARVNA